MAFHPYCKTYVKAVSLWFQPNFAKMLTPMFPNNNPTESFNVQFKCFWTSQCTLFTKAFGLYALLSAWSLMRKKIFFSAHTSTPKDLAHLTLFSKTSHFLFLIPFCCQWVTSFSTAMRENYFPVLPDAAV